jgi:Transcription factor WhiB
MHKVTKHLMSPEEAVSPTPCASDPERWFPIDQKPDAEAVAACWSCYFQSDCARRALAEPLPDHGIWGGYRLAPGPGLKRSRRQLAIVARETMGPPASPGSEVLVALEESEAESCDEVGDVIEIASRATARNVQAASALHSPETEAAGPFGDHYPFQMAGAS